MIEANQALQKANPFFQGLQVVVFVVKCAHEK